MDHTKWENVLLQWVNCLKLCKNVQSLEDLRTGEFFCNLQKVITKSFETECDTLTFIFEILNQRYPNYVIENQYDIHLSDLPLSDLKAIVTLLMHYTCIYDRRDVLTSPLCYSLSQANQLIVRNFLQNTTGSITKEELDHVISNAVKTSRLSESPSCHWLSGGSASSVDSPLKSILNTPVSKSGRFQEKDKHIARLENELEIERYEKRDFQEQLNLCLDRYKKLEKILEQKCHEIYGLRGEIVSLENRTPPHYQDTDSRDVQKRLRLEIQNLEQYVQQLEEELEQIRQEKDISREKFKEAEFKSHMWQEKFFESEKSLEVVTNRSQEQQNEIQNLKQHCAELTAMLEEFKSRTAVESFTEESFLGTSNSIPSSAAASCENLAHSVVEVQLREVQRELEEMTSEFKQAKERCTDLEKEKRRLILELSERRDLLEQREEELLTCNKDIAEIGMKVITQNSEMNELKKQLTIQAESLAHLQSLSQKLEEDKSNLSNEKMQLEQKLMEMTTEFEMQTKVLENSEVKNQEQENQIHILKQEVVTYRDKLQISNKELTVTQGALVILEESIANLKKEIEVLNSEKSMLKGTNENLEKDISNNIALQDKLSQELNDSKKENEKIVKQYNMALSTKDSEIKKLELEKLALKKEAADQETNFNNEMSSKIQEILALKEDYFAFKNSQQELLYSANEQITELHQKLVKKNEELELIKTSLEEKEKEMKQQIFKHNNEISTLSRKLLESENQNQTFEENINDLRTKCFNYKECMENLNKTIQLQEKTLEDSHRSEECLNKEIEVLKNIEIKLKDNNNNLNETNIALNKKVATLEELESSLEKQIADLEKDAEALKTTIKTLHNNMNEMQKKLHNKNAELNEVIASLENEKALNTILNREMESQLLKSNKEISTLSQKLEESKQFITELKENINTIKVEGDNYKKCINKLNTTVQLRETALDDSNKLQESLRKEIDALRDTKVKLKQDNNNLNTKTITLNEKLGNLEELKLSLEKQIADLTINGETLQNLVKNVEGNLSEMQKTLDNRSQELKDLTLCLEKERANNLLLRTQMENQLSELKDESSMLKQRLIESENLNKEFKENINVLKKSEDNYKKCIEELTVTIQSQEELLHDSNKLQENLKKEIDKLKSIEMKQKDDINNLTETNIELNKQLATLEELESSLEKQVAHLTNDAETSQSIIKALQNNVNEMQKNLVDKNTKVNEITASLENEKDINTMLSKEVENQLLKSNEEMSKLSQKLEESRHFIKELEEDINTLKVGEDNYKNYIEKLNTTIQFQETALDDSNKLQENLRKEIDALKNTEVELKQDNNNLNENIITLNEKLASLEGLKLSLEKQIADLTINAETLQNSITDLEGNISEMQITLDNKSQELKDLTSCLDEERANNLLLLTQMENQLSKLKAETCMLNQKLIESDNLNKELKEDINALKKAEDNYKKCIEKLNVTIQSQEELLQDSNKLQENLKKEIDKLKSIEIKQKDDNNNLNEKIVMLNNKVVSLEELKSSLENKLATSTSNAATLQDSLNKFKNNINEMQEQLGNRNRELKEIMLALDDGKANNVLLKKEMVNQLCKLEDQISLLGEKLIESQNCNKELTEDINTLKKQEDVYKECIEKLNVTINTQEKALESSNITQNIFKQEIDELKSTEMTLREKIVTLNNKVISVEELKLSLEGQIADLTKKTETLHYEVETLQTKLDQKEKKIIQLTSLLEEDQLANAKIRTDLEDQILKAQQEIELLNKNVFNFKILSKELETKLSLMVTKEDNYKEEIEKLNVAIGLQGNASHNMHGCIEDLKKQVSNLTQCKFEVENENDSLRGQIKMLNDKISITEDMKKSLENQLAELEKEKIESVEKLQEIIDNQEKQWFELTEENIQIHNVLTEKDEFINQMQLKVSELEGLKLQLEEKLSNVCSELENEKALLVDAERNMKELENNLKKVNLLNDNYQKQLFNLQQEYMSITEALTVSESLKKNHLAVIDSLKEDLKNAADTNILTQETVAKLKGEILSVNKLNISLNAQIENLEKAKKEQETSLKNDIILKEQEIAALKHEKTNTTEIVSCKDFEMKNLKNELSNLYQSLNDLKHQKQSLEETLHTLKEENLKDLQRIESHYDIILAEHKSTFENLRTVSEKITKELNHCKAENQELQEELSETVKEKQKLETHMKECEFDVSRTKQELKVLQNENNEIKMMYNDLKTLINDHLETIKSLRNKNDKLESDIKNLTDDLIKITKSRDETLKSRENIEEETENKILRAQEKIAEVQKRLEIIDKQRQAECNEKKQLQNDLNNEIKLRGKLESDLEKLKHELNITIEARSLIEAKLVSIEGDLSKETRNREKTENDLSELKRELENQNNAKEVLERSLAKLQTQLNDEAKCKDTLNKTALELQEKLEIQIKENQTIKEELIKLQSELEKQAKVGNLKDDLLKLQNQLTREEQSKQIIQQKLLDVETELKKEIETKQILEGNICQLSKENALLHNQIKDVYVKCTGAKGMQDIDKESIIFEKTLEAIENLKEANSKSCKSIEDTENLKKQIIGLETLVDSLKKDVALLTTQKEEEAMALESLQTDYDLLVSKYNQAVVCRDRFEEEYNSLQQKYEVLEKNKENICNGCSAFKSSSEPYKKKLETIFSQRTMLENLLTNMRMTMMSVQQNATKILIPPSPYKQLLEKKEALEIIIEDIYKHSSRITKQSFDLTFKLLRLYDRCIEGFSTNNGFKVEDSFSEINIDEIVEKITDLNDRTSDALEQLKVLNKDIENVQAKQENKSLKTKENMLAASGKLNVNVEKFKEEEWKKKNMMLKQKLTLSENAKSNLERKIRQLQEENKKLLSQQSNLESDVHYKMLLEEHVATKQDHERVLRDCQEQYSKLLAEKEDLQRQKALSLEICVEKDKTELQNLREAYSDVVSANSKLEMEIISLRQAVEERSKQLGELLQIKEAYEKLLEENSKLMTEVDTVKYKRTRDREEFIRLLKKDREEMEAKELKRIQQIRIEYENKLEKMKDKMLKLYREEVNKEMDRVKSGQDQNINLIQAIENLRSDLFEAEQKISFLETERDILRSRTQRQNESSLYFSRESLQSNDFKLPESLVRNPRDRDSIRSTNSCFSNHSTVPENRMLSSNSESNKLMRKVNSSNSIASGNAQDICKYDERKGATLPRTTPMNVIEEITISRRTSFGLPSSIGQNLQMEDEDDDCFNNKYLTDLKEGRCILPTGRDTQRYSELAWRNSMVPPHLKSSYPAEMQFVSPTRFKEDEIKAGNIELDNSLVKLLPGEKPRKKDFGTTSYKKPGPPTPSKNGGRLSLQGNEVHPLREHNADAKTPKRSTPNRIRALFLGKGRDNSENQSSPKSRRVSFFRKPR